MYWFRNNNRTFLIRHLQLSTFSQYLFINERNILSLKYSKLDCLWAILFPPFWFSHLRKDFIIFNTSCPVSVSMFFRQTLPYLHLVLHISSQIVWSGQRQIVISLHLEVWEVLIPLAWSCKSLNFGMGFVALFWWNIL